MRTPENKPFFLGPIDTDVACLLIHGFSGTPEEMRNLGEAIAACGIRVHGIVVQGHGGTPEELLHSTRKQWITSAEQGLAALKDYPKLFVAGLSMGGVLSLLLASRHPQRLAGVIALSTPTRFGDGWQVKALPVARYFIKWFYPLERLDFTDPEVQAEVLKQARLRDSQVTIDFSTPNQTHPTQLMVRLPVPALDELVRLTNKGRSALSKVQSPLLIIHSKRDQTVHPDCANELYRLTTAASPKALHWLEQSDHVITTGLERDEVFQLVTEFIKTRIDDAAKTARPVDAPVE